jgi:hypothetical protein
MGKWKISEEAAKALKEKTAFTKHYFKCLDHNVCPYCGDDIKETTEYNPKVFFKLIPNGYKTKQSCKSCDFVRYHKTVNLGNF